MKTLLMFLTPIIAMSSASQGRTAGESRLDYLKGSIIQIGKNNQNNLEEILDVRNQLDPLVNELLELAPSQTEAQRASLAVGGWKHIWSDQEFGYGSDLSQIYQVVSPKGFYYNISKVDSPRGELTNFLRGAYQDKGSYLSIEFTNNQATFGFYPAGTDLAHLAEEFESGHIPSQSIPGPIGVTGILMNIYVDHDLRIVYGNSISDSRPRLFLLERSAIIQP